MSLLAGGINGEHCGLPVQASTEGVGSTSLVLLDSFVSVGLALSEASLASLVEVSPAEVSVDVVGEESVLSVVVLSSVELVSEEVSEVDVDASALVVVCSPLVSPELEVSLDVAGSAVVVGSADESEVAVEEVWSVELDPSVVTEVVVSEAEDSVGDSEADSVVESEVIDALGVSALDVVSEAEVVVASEEVDSVMDSDVVVVSTPVDSAVDSEIVGCGVVSEAVGSVAEPVVDSETVDSAVVSEVVDSVVVASLVGSSVELESEEVLETDALLDVDSS